MKTEYKTLLFDVRDHVAHLTLNRPDAANSINEDMGKDLMYAALRCDEDPEIRAVLISGTGKIFSGGGDLKAFLSQGDQLPFHVKKITTYLHAAISRLTRMDAPVVAAVHGAVAGAGMSIAIACDIVVAAETPGSGLHPRWAGTRWFFNLFSSQDCRSQARLGTDPHQSHVFCPRGITVGPRHTRGAR
jgi:enoyl-CoA hydratase/carnithine racemase